MSYAEDARPPRRTDFVHLEIPIVTGTVVEGGVVAAPATRAAVVVVAAAAAAVVRC